MTCFRTKASLSNRGPTGVTEKRGPKVTALFTLLIYTPVLKYIQQEELVYSIILLR